MKPDNLSLEIIRLVKSYCKPAVVSSLIQELKKAEAFEEKLTGAVKRKSREFSLEKGDTLDHLLTLCQLELSGENNVSVTLGIGDVFRNHGELGRAEELYSRALAEAEGLTDQELTAEALLRRGDIYSRQGRWEVCENDLEYSRKIYRTLNKHVSIGRVDNVQGTNCAIQGRLKQAQLYYKKALSSFERYADSQMTGTVLMNLGIVYNILGKYDEALSQYKRAGSFFEQIGDHARLAELHHNMGMSYMSKNEYKSALAEFTRVEGLVNKASSINLIGLARLGKANAFFRLKDYRMSLGLTHDALQCFTASNDRLSIADTYKVKGMIHREMKKYSFAASYFQTSLRINIELKNLLNTGETYVEIGILERRKGLPDEAGQAFKNAIDCFRKIGARNEISRAEELKALAQ